MVIKKFSLIFCLLLLFSCSKKVKPTVERDYIKAYETLIDGGYSEAAQLFEKIEDDYPFSDLASKAQTMAAYAYYKNEDYEEVDRIVDDFIRINPNHDSIPYMLYLKGRGYYNKIPDIKRAQDSARKASQIFREVRARFPETKYADDVRLKLVNVDNHIAGALMSVGRYQMRQENYVGAIKNFEEVIYRYSRTNQNAEAYYRLFEVYYKLGIEEEAKKCYDNLLVYFAENDWTKKAQEILLAE